MTPFVIMGKTLELLDDTESKWLQDEMDVILTTAWLAGYKIKLLDLGKDETLRVLKLNLYHDKFDGKGLHRFTFDLVFKPANTYWYSIFHCNDKDIIEEMPEDFAVIDGKKHSLQGTIHPTEDGPFDMKKSAIEYFKKYIINSIHAY